ncbi:MAG: hypothetical protein ABIP20_17150 [Chthoniobacteraceae bacterium]
MAIRLQSSCAATPSKPNIILNEGGGLCDMSNAPFVEKTVAPETDTDASKADRTRLTAVVAELNPAGGKKGERKKKKAEKSAGAPA